MMRALLRSRVLDAKIQSLQYRKQIAFGKKDIHLECFAKFDNEFNHSSLDIIYLSY